MKREPYLSDVLAYLSEDLVDSVLTTFYKVLMNCKKSINMTCYRFAVIAVPAVLIFTSYAIKGTTTDTTGSTMPTTTKITVVKEYMYTHPALNYTTYSEKIASYRSGQALLFLKEEAVIHKVVGKCMSQFASNPLSRFTYSCDGNEAKSLVELHVDEQKEMMMEKFNRYFYGVGLEVVDMRTHNSAYDNYKRVYIDCRLIDNY